MLRQVFAINKPLRSIFYKFSNVSTLFNLKNREHLISPLLSNLHKSQKTDTSTLNQQIPKQYTDSESTKNIKQSKLDKQDQSEGVEEKESVEEGEQQNIFNQQEISLMTAQTIINNLSNKLRADLSSGNLLNFDKSIRDTLKLLKNKNLKQIELMTLFQVIRSYRPRLENKVMISEQTQNSIKLFIANQKNNKVLKNICENWVNYDYHTLLKICSLYRYLPQSVIRESLQKLFDIVPTYDLGYLKHFEIMNQIIKKKQRIQLGQIPHLLVKGKQLFNHIFSLNFGDLETVIKFIHRYNVSTSSRMLGGSVYHLLSLMMRPQRKGYKNDFDLFKQISNIYWGCINIKSKIRVKFIQDIPIYLQSLSVQTQDNVLKDHNLSSLLEGFQITSSFTNVNQHFGRLIEDSLSKITPQQLKQITPQLTKYLNSLMQSIKPQYSLNSIQSPANNLVKDIAVSVIRTLLNININSYIFDFLKYEFDPYVYNRVIFRNPQEYQPYLNKYMHILQNTLEHTLKIVRHFCRNIKNIQQNNPKLKDLIESTWKKIGKQSHKWPICLNYYFHYITLSKHLGCTLKDITKHVESIITKIQKNQKDSENKNFLPIIVNSKSAHLQYFLPVLDLIKPQLLKKKTVQKFIVDEVVPTIRRWDVIDFSHNLKVFVDHFQTLPKKFIDSMLQNLSVLTMIDNLQTYVHPDIDRTLIQRFIKLILNNYKSINIETIDLKVFEMLCVISKKSFNDDLVKKLLEMIGFKEQNYIGQMIGFLQAFQFQSNNLEQVSELMPSTFNNVKLNEYIKNTHKRQSKKAKSSRQIKKDLTETLDDPQKRLNTQYNLDALTTKQQKTLYLMNRFYQAIIKPNSQEEIEELQNKIFKLFPAERSHDVYHLNVVEQEKMSVYDQFTTNQKKAANTKYQLVKLKDFVLLQNESVFQTVDLLTFPIQEQILRNFGKPSYIQNQILPKINQDVSKAFQNLKPWFQKVGINGKIRNNAIILRSKEKKSWVKTVVVIIAKPQVFKINLVAAYLVNRISDTEFVVIEQESSIDNTIKNFVYKRNNII